MGKALPSGVGAAGTPPDAQKPFTNAVVTGSISAVGPTTPFAFYGKFNVLIWAQAVTTLTTTAGSLSATVSSATGLAVGQTISGSYVPAGTTIGAISGTNVTLAVPANKTSADVSAGADAAAIFEHVVPEATVRLERSLDGGTTWVVAGVGGAGAAASYAMGASGITNPISVVVDEPEQSVAYRLNCTIYTSGSIKYRLSASGAAALAWGAGQG